jgi:hypothetical protein
VYIEALSELKHNVKDAVEKSLSIESFIKRKKIPDVLKIGFERFGEATLKHWFEYYA